MIEAFKSFLKSRKAKVLLEAEVDHVEVGEDYLMLGLDLIWQNDTPEELLIREVLVVLYVHGKKKEGIKCYVQGHFERLPQQRVIKKIIGTKPFMLPSGKPHREHMRFMTRAVLELAPGHYDTEVHSTILEGTYVHDVTLEVTTKSRYRSTEAWNA